MSDTEAMLAFGAARLDEDEAAARAAASVAGPDWHHEPGVTVDGATTMILSTTGALLADTLHRDDEEMAPHIARHDPGRALREVEAKRAILAEHRCDDMGWCTRCQTPLPDAREDEDQFAPVNWPCPTVRITFAVYSDHPDYRPEWKP